MKKQIYILLALPLMLLSCSEDTTVIIPDTTAVTLKVTSSSPYAELDNTKGEGIATLRSAGTPIRFSVESSVGDWTLIEPTSTWLEIGRDVEGFTISANPNQLSDQRSTQLAVKTGEQHAPVYFTLDISQKAVGEPEISISQGEVTISGSGNTPQTVNVETNQDDFEIDFNSTWLLAEKSDGQITFTADPNPEEETRSARVTVTAGYGRNIDQVSVMVTQKGSSEIIFSRGSKNFPSAGGEAEIKILIASEECVIGEIEDDWITASVNDRIITIRTSEYNGVNMRTGRVPVIQGDEAPNYITVKQAGYEDMVIELRSSSVIASQLPLGGEVNCTIDWDDETIETVDAKYPKHAYTQSGEYTVFVRGTVTALTSTEIFNTDPTPLNFITKVHQWGLTDLTEMDYAFEGCVNLSEVAPDNYSSLAEVRSFSFTFKNTGLTTVPSGIFRTATKATVFAGTFYEATKLESVPVELFASNPDVNNFVGTFYGCTSLETVPAGLFDNNTKVVTFQKLFMLSGIKTVPAGLFSKCPEVLDMTELFMSSQLEEIPAGLLDNNTKVTGMTYLFGSTQITSIPAGLFDNNTEVQSFQAAFNACSNLAVIPSGLFRNTTKVTIFASVFRSTAITEIPSGLFDNTPRAVYFDRAFELCRSLTTIPAGLFSHTPEVTTFAYVFNNTGITSVPGDIFSNAGKVETFTYAFSTCGKLATIGAGLFDSAVAATDFSNVFSSCSVLATLPANLFSNCTNADTFYRAFQSCFALDNLGSGIFAGLTKVTTYNSVFAYCRGLTSIPANTFAGNTGATNFAEALRNTGLITVDGALFADCTAVTSFEGLFNTCGSLTNVPANLFASNTAVTSFRNTFAACTNLTSIPTGIFDNNKAVTNFNMTFTGCTSLTGETPYTDVGGTIVKLWNRNTDNGFARPTSTTRCFYNCTGLSDYGSIATGWK